MSSSSSLPAWAAALHEAVQREEGGARVEVLRGRWPRALLHEAVRLLSTVALAGTAAALAVFRWRTSGPDALALLAEFVTLLLAARTVAALLRFAARLREAASGRRWALALGEEGLLLQAPGELLALRREELLDARAEGAWASRPAADRWVRLLLVARPGSVAGAPWRALPPVFEDPPAALAERIMRWRGPLQPGEPPEAPDLPSRRYEEAARGGGCEGCVALPLRPSWLLEAPLASPLMGLALLHLQAAGGGALAEARGTPPLGLLGGLLLLVPLGWVALAWRQLRPRMGLALLLHPGALMLRSRAGVLAVPWRQVLRVHVAERTSWSVLRGAHPARTLVVERRGAPALHYVESWLGAPAEAVASLAEAYRRGLASIERAASSASRASS